MNKKALFATGRMKFEMFCIFMMFTMLSLTINVSAVTNKTVFTGDSVTYALNQVTSTQRFSYIVNNWVSSKFGSTYTQVNTGIASGCLSDYGAECPTRNPLVDRIASDITDYDGKYIVIHTPVNDNQDAIQVPINEFETDYRTIIESINSNNPNATLILTGYAKIDHENWNSESTIARFRQFNQLISNLSCEYDLAFIDLYKIIGDDINDYTVDGVHYSVTGHQFISTYIEDAIENSTKYKSRPTNIKININANTGTVNYKLNKNYVSFEGQGNPNLTLLSGVGC